MFTLSLRPPTPQYERKAESQTLNYMLKKFSMSSPILDEALIRVAPKRMDATLLQRIPPVIYRGEPSYEVDKAWQDLVDTRPVRLTRQQVLALGKDPDQAVEVPADWVLDENDSSNSNETHYFGRVDVFHQIHCLDALRREAYFEHYYGRENPHGYNDTSEFHRLHLSHCVYLLLQNIMCQASTDMYTHIWTDTLEHPFPDFNIDHQCKDFDAIMAWQKKHALDEEAFIRLKRPPGYPYKKMNRKFKEIHGWDFGRDGEVGQDEGEIA
ncbi:hypothetical protein C8A03DRAFT_30897 [Achaetomium macrosporum]|uniref:Tat pathway signal sequence n=1 Tax=Achaetomium macrosporum TaxID=79813 RepID=A0AAN7CFA2_9PEZI|nr:hypothetical protein C8A03DRAFT_30897 [Achaetomium macrosporum]